MQNRGHVIEAYGPDDVIWFPKMGRLKRLRLLLGYTFATLNQALRKKFDLIELWGGPGWLAVVLLKWIPRSSFVVVARSNGLEPHYSCVMNSGRLFDSRESMASLPSTAVELGFQKSDALTVVSRFDDEFAKARNYQPSDRILAIRSVHAPDLVADRARFPQEGCLGFVGVRSGDCAFGMGHVPVDSIKGEPIALATGDAQNMIPTGSDMTSEASAYGSGVEKIYGRGATGFLVPIRSPETIAECIAWCCDHREEVVAIGKAAMDKSQEYTWKAYGDGIVHAVQDAVRKR